MRRYVSLLCILALLVGCYNIDEQLINEPIPSEGRIFTASFEQNDTRTYVEEGNLLRWNAGDQITIFDSNTLNQQYRFDGETGDNGGTFSKVSNSFGTGNDLNCHYAVYPYNKDIKITETGVITANLPAEQSYAENSFGLGANTMVAVTKDVDDTFLKFKNVGGYLKLQLYGDNVTVKSITLTGNNNKKIAGKVTITPAYGQSPSIVMSDDATTGITLDCGEGIKIGTTEETATAFWIVVPPTTFEEGFEVTITDINGVAFTKSTSNIIVVERNIIKPMAAFEVEIEEPENGEETIPNNQIWYTSSDGNIIAPKKTGDFGANIISNVYENGKGIITFDGDITSIAYQAFSYCNTLTSISIPKSIATIGEAAFSNCQHITEFEIPNSVTTIGKSAFASCTSLTSVNIPNSVIAIGDYAFNVCNNLANITIGNNVTTIGKQAFGNCHYITEVKIPDSVTTIKEGAFKSCSNLKNVTIGNGVTTIEKTAFGYCRSLMNFKGNYASKDGKCLIINGVLNAFAIGCNPTEYIIPDGTITISKAAFWCCDNLTYVAIPNSVTTIDDAAFYACYNLACITIPKNVTTIGSEAFCGCDNIASFYCKAVVPPILGENALDTWDGYKYITLDCNFYVPAGSLGAYQKADYWKDLNLIEEENPIQAVDLGLSVKWANCNVGTNSPEEYGDYFAWGETVPKSNYSSSNMLILEKIQEGLKLNGVVDTNNNLTASYDAAAANWGENWRMPTRAEIEELLTNCTWTWSTQNGTNGYIVCSKTNENSIFLPAAGFRQEAYPVAGLNESGLYLSATYDNDIFMFCLQFNNNGIDDPYRGCNSNFDCSMGCLVRPVTK